MSKGVQSAFTLPTALVQSLADGQISELQSIPLRSMVLPRPREQRQRYRAHEPNFEHHEHRGPRAQGRMHSVPRLAPGGVSTMFGVPGFRCAADQSGSGQFSIMPGIDRKKPCAAASVPQGSEIKRTLFRK